MDESILFYTITYCIRLMDLTQNLTTKQETEDEEKAKRKEKKKRSADKERATKKERARKREFMRDIAVMAQVRKHPEFVKSPMETISTHIQNSILLEHHKRDEDMD